MSPEAVAMTERRALILCADGRSIVLARNGSPDPASVARIVEALAAQGTPAWLVGAEGAFGNPRSRPRLRRIRQLVPGGSWPQAVEAFHALRAAEAGGRRRQQRSAALPRARPASPISASITAVQDAPEASDAPARGRAHDQDPSRGDEEEARARRRRDLDELAMLAERSAGRRMSPSERDFFDELLEGAAVALRGPFRSDELGRATWALLQRPRAFHTRLLDLARKLSVFARKHGGWRSQDEALPFADDAAVAALARLHLLLWREVRAAILRAPCDGADALRTVAAEWFVGDRPGLRASAKDVLARRARRRRERPPGGLLPEAADAVLVIRRSAHVRLGPTFDIAIAFLFTAYETALGRSFDSPDAMVWLSPLRPLPEDEEGRRGALRRSQPPIALEDRGAGERGAESGALRSFVDAAVARFAPWIRLGEHALRPARNRLLGAVASEREESRMPRPWSSAETEDWPLISDG